MAIAEAGTEYMRSLFSQPLYMFEMAHNNNNNKSLLGVLHFLYLLHHPDEIMH